MAAGKPSRAGKVRRRRTFDVRLIRRHETYSTSDLTEQLSVHENTVAQWRKRGLEPIDDHRPLLFHGSAVISFLSKRQAARRHPCAEDEFYCCRCRGPRKAWEGAVDVDIHTDRRLVLKAVCTDCGAGMNRVTAMHKLDRYREVFDFQTLRDRRLKG